jgi:hypothetical protein
MVRQVSSEVTDGLRADMRLFMATRPDLSGPDFAANSTLADGTVRSFLSGAIAGGTEVCSELRRVL